ncbi:MAG: hypothetical protein JEZ04_18075 [Spirochaetales bacterium]|nr:hypothetical protein [Spirochaetales bacterium]
MINKIDKLTFPNMYKSDFLEILWLLMRENIKSDTINPAIDLLKSKRLSNDNWNLERMANNLTTTIGVVKKANQFITKKASEVLDYYI